MPQQPLHTQQLTHPRAGEVKEIKSGEEEDAQQEVSRAETLALCQRLDGKEPASSSLFGNANPSLPLDLLK